MVDHLPRRRARPCSDACGNRAADAPAERGADQCDGSRFRECLHFDLPASCACPEQPPTRLGDLATQRGGSEDRERKQERAGLAAEQQQPSCGDARRADCGGERVGRSRHLEGIRARGELCAHAVDRARVCRDRPRVHVTRLHGHEPRIGAEERRELGRARETVDAVGEQHRRRLRCVVADGTRDLFALHRLDPRRERRVAAQCRGADLDQPQRWLRRHGSAALEAQHFAVRRDARVRQPSGAQPHEWAETVGRAKVDQPAADLRLAVEHRVHRIAAEHRRHLTVERAPVAGERAEPRDLQRAVGRRKLRSRLRECAVLHHEPA